MGFLAALLLVFDLGSPKPCESDFDCFDSSFGGWCDPQDMACGVCTDDEQCEHEDAICDQGSCVIPCADAMDCDPAVPLCDPEASRCVGCVEHADCPAEQHCDNERCIDDVCTPGELSCLSGDVAVCDDDGAGRSVVEICLEGWTCQDSGGTAMCVEGDTGSSTSGGTTGGETGDDPSGDFTGGPTGEPVDDDPAADSGCGCTLTGSPAVWGFAPLLLLLVRIRRARPRRRP